jgi:hypothetical protein
MRLGLAKLRLLLVDDCEPGGSGAPCDPDGHLLAAA